MGKPIRFESLELPEFLSQDEMDRFRLDPNFRAERRRQRLAKLGPVVGKTALRGRKRDWLNQSAEPVPKPEYPSPEMVRRVAAKLVISQPITDKLTERYDIKGSYKFAQNYGMPKHRNYLKRIDKEERDPQRIEILLQGAERSLFHTRDNLQINLWRMSLIAQLRLSYIDTVLNAVSSNRLVDPVALKQTGWAIADVGYCLKQNSGIGLLKNIGQDESLADSIESTGDYIADGHVDALYDNLDLVWLARQEQEKRSIYWSTSYQASVKALGKRLPDEELTTDRDINDLMRELYSQQSDEYWIAS